MLLPARKSSPARDALAGARATSHKPSRWRGWLRASSGVQRKSAAQQAVEALLGSAGIAVGGSRSSDIQVHNADFFARVVAHGSLGLGESYMDGWWDARSLDG